MLDNVIFEGGIHGVGLTDEEYQSLIHQAPEYIGMPVEEFKDIVKSQITPRMFLAGCALIGHFVRYPSDKVWDVTRVEEAYQIADAMLKKIEKEKTRENITSNEDNDINPRTGYPWSHRPNSKSK